MTAALREFALLTIVLCLAEADASEASVIVNV
jgi:hypothetical protein